MSALQSDKAARFAALHDRPGAFVIPNPWDIGTARMLAGLGFEALATTSAGFAFSLGRRDGAVTRDEALAHCRSIVDATPLPVSADLENGYDHRPEAVPKRSAARPRPASSAPRSRMRPAIATHRSTMPPKRPSASMPRSRRRADSPSASLSPHGPRIFCTAGPISTTPSPGSRRSRRRARTSSTHRACAISRRSAHSARGLEAGQRRDGTCRRAALGRPTRRGRSHADQPRLGALAGRTRCLAPGGAGDQGTGHLRLCRRGRRLRRPLPLLPDATVIALPDFALAGT